MSNTTGQLGNVISSPAIRQRIYGTYVVLVVVAGGIQVAYATPDLGGQPVWLTVALNVLAYLGAPVGGLALANTSSARH